jgi:hypothetical protein
MEHGRGGRRGERGKQPPMNAKGRESGRSSFAKLPPTHFELWCDKGEAMSKGPRGAVGRIFNTKQTKETKFTKWGTRSGTLDCWLECILKKIRPEAELA